MTAELTNSSTASHSFTFGSRTKELCSFCNERPFDLVCQCGDKFDFNCIAQHVEALNFQYHDFHVAAGSELTKLEAAKRNVRSDSYQETIDSWVRLRTQDIHDIAEAAKNGFKSNEQANQEADELIDMYTKLHEIQEQSVHDRLTFIVELKDRMKQIQLELQAGNSPTASHSQLDESLRAKLSGSSSATASGDSHMSSNGFDTVSSRVETAPEAENPRTNIYRAFSAGSAAPAETTQRPFMNGFGRHEPPTPEPARAPASPTEMPYVPLSFERPSAASTTRVEPPSSAPTARVEMPSVVPPPRVDPPSPSPARFPVPPPSPAAARVEVSPPVVTRDPFDALPSAVHEELPTPSSLNPPVEPPKPVHVPEAPKPVPVPEPIKKEAPVPAPAESGASDEFDAGLSGHISRRTFKSISAKNDQNAGTLCSHDDQLIYVDFDDATKKSQVIFLHNVEKTDEKLIMDWIPPSETGSSGSNEDWIRDITYCTRLDTYLLITQTGIHTWNDRDDRFKEYHRMVGRQLKRITTDQHFMYLISASGRMTARGDTIIFLSYDKDEVAKAFTDIIPSRMNRGTAPLNGEITDIAVAPRDQLMITYRIERRSEVGICLFTVTNRGRDWSCVKQLQLNECWHNSLTYTPRVEWSSKLNVFVLIEYMTGHLLMIGQDGHVQGECRFTHNEGKSESPINLTISNRDWLCTRYDSMIVVKKLE